VYLIKSGGGTGPVKPGNRNVGYFIDICMVLIPAALADR